MAGGPFCISVQMIEVQSQVEPLFSLGVLEVAAKSIGISLRLETCLRRMALPGSRSKVLAAFQSVVSTGSSALGFV